MKVKLAREYCAEAPAGFRWRVAVWAPTYEDERLLRHIAEKYHAYVEARKKECVTYRWGVLNITGHALSLEEARAALKRAQREFIEYARYVLEGEQEETWEEAVGKVDLWDGLTLYVPVGLEEKIEGEGRS